MIGKRKFQLFFLPCLLILFVVQIASAQVTNERKRVRIYDALLNQQAPAITPDANTEVIAVWDRFVILTDTRVKIYDPNGHWQTDIITAGRAQVLNSAERIIIVDNDRVRSYNVQSGHLLARISTNEQAHVILAVERIIVRDRNRVRIYTHAGAQLGKTLLTSAPAPKVVTGADRILVVDNTSLRIYDPNGQQQGPVINTDDPPTLAFISGRIVVADSLNVRVFDSAGTHLYRIGTNTHAQVVTGAGRIIISDDGRVRIYDLLGNLQGASIPTRTNTTVRVFDPGSKIDDFDRIVIVDDDRVRIYDLLGNQQNPPTSITTRGPVSVYSTVPPNPEAGISSLDRILVTEDHRTRIFDLLGFQQGGDIRTDSRADVIIPEREGPASPANRIALVDNTKVRIFDHLRQQYGRDIRTTGRADVQHMRGLFVVTDDRSVRIYNKSGLQQGRDILTNGRAVAKKDWWLLVADQIKVRAFNFFAEQQGSTVFTEGRAEILQLQMNPNLLVVDNSPDPITRLTAVNDSPTRLGNPTTLIATIATGSNVIYVWEFGDGSTGNGRVATHTYDAAGSYTASVTASNSIGSATAATEVIISADPLANDAVFVAQTVPTILYSGQQSSVSITMKNTGTATWTAARGYKLGSVNPPDNILWTPVSRQPLDVGEAVAQDQLKTFTFDITAPLNPGVYDFQWRMLQEEGDTPRRFGQFTPNVAIEVVSRPWIEEYFDNLQRGPLHGQNGWFKAAPYRDSAIVMAAPGGGNLLHIDAPAGGTIVMGKDFPDQFNGLHVLRFRVQVTDATTPSIAKIEIGTHHTAGWNKKFQVYFGNSMRLNYGPDGRAVVFIMSTETGHWYEIQCVMDLDANQVEVWVDGVRQAAGISMHPGPVTSLGLSGWDRAGFVRLDDLVGHEIPR